MSFQRPTDPRLARIFDQALRRGEEIRYADEQQVVVYRQNRWGFGGWMLLIVLGLLTAFIVPIILLILGALAPGGTITTYTLKRGRIHKKRVRARS